MSLHEANCELERTSDSTEFWIQTLRGEKFVPADPDFLMIDPDELAIVLSRICRFNGHCREFYSVAQHSVLVCDLVAERELKLPALLHDAHEAYWGFGDPCRPSKMINDETRRFLRRLAELIDVAVASRFGFSYDLFQHESIKRADELALATEQRDLMPPPPAKWDLRYDPSNLFEVKPEPSSRAASVFKSRLCSLWENKE